VFTNFRRMWRAAAAGCARALAIEPSDAWIRAWYALVLAGQGDVNRALVEIRRARGLQPLSLPIQAQEGWILFWAGRVHEAMMQWQRTLEVDPNFPLAHYNLGLGYTRPGVHDQAVARFSRALELVPGRVALPALRASMLHVASSEAHHRQPVVFVLPTADVLMS
jgi:tetratricopeptide (TPR) repeat protein